MAMHGYKRIFSIEKVGHEKIILGNTDLSLQQSVEILPETVHENSLIGPDILTLLERVGLYSKRRHRNRGPKELGLLI